MLMCLLLVSCGGKGQRSQALEKQTKQFTLPVIPSIITDPSERADYLAGHYWDNFDFSDTSLIRISEISEQAIVNYIDIFPHVSAGALRLSITNTLKKAQSTPKMFAFFTEQFEHYLYDPNAPMRNEESYRVVLDFLIESSQVDELNKVRPRFQLEQVNKNRPGVIATDFVYTLPNGRQESMHKIKSDFLILFFNNPGCSACGEYQEGLVRSPVIINMMETGRLKIFAMYVDQEIAGWLEYLPSIPPSWVNGYDASTVIRNNNLYDLRAIPSLYLLDKDKRVILKDALPQQIEETLLFQLQNNK
jgi:hypothetical protein